MGQKLGQKQASTTTQGFTAANTEMTGVNSTFFEDSHSKQVLKFPKSESISSLPTFGNQKMSSEIPTSLDGKDTF